HPGDEDLLARPAHVHVPGNRRRLRAAARFRAGQRRSEIAGVERADGDAARAGAGGVAGRVVGAAGASLQHGLAAAPSVASLKGSGTMLRTVYWQKLRRPEIAAARDAGAVVLLPVGSTEQHGAHLAVDMDAMGATAVSARAAEQVTEFPVLVAPTVWSGYSPHHMENPGTITLPFDTFAAVLTDVVDSIMRPGFRHVFLINAPGGNIGHLSALR